MSFKLKRKEAVSESVYRIARKAVERALERCKKEELESIHETRKQIKKLRAVLRLFRCDLGKKPVEQLFDELREAAEYLAAPRDARVKAEAFEQLFGKKRRKATARLSATRAELQRECAAQAARFRQQKDGGKVRAILRKMPSRFAKLHFKHDGWRAIGPGLTKSYQAAQKCRERAAKDPSPENFHEWRKRVKDVLYSVQLLEPIWPEQMCALAAELGSLGELLGDDHDLHMLRQSAIKKSVDVDLEPEITELLGLIEPRQKELRARALKLGSRIFGEKSLEFCERLHAYWKHWKSKSGKSGKKQRQGSVRLRRLGSAKPNG